MRCRTGPVDLPAHLDRLRSLLGAEREAEKDRFAEATAKLSLAERATRGMAAVDLQAADEEGLAGRALVTFAPAAGPGPGGAQIGVGSPVRVVQRREVPEDAPSGIVARRTRGRMRPRRDGRRRHSPAPRGWSQLRQIVSLTHRGPATSQRPGSSSSF